MDKKLLLPLSIAAITAVSGISVTYNKRSRKCNQSLAFCRNLFEESQRKETTKDLAIKNFDDNGRKY